MEEYGVLGIVVEVGICVGQDYLWTWTIGRYLYTLSRPPERRERLYFCLPAPMTASWAQRTGKRIAHTET
jgi:hypothetical protein